MAAAPSGPAHRLAALRGELWDRHATMRTLNPDDAEYEDASARVLDLTTELLGLEAEAAADSRSVHRRAGQVGFAVCALLLATAVALAVASQALRLPAAAVAAASLLALAVLVFAVTWWIRRRGVPPTPDVPTGGSDGPGAEAPVTDPEPTTAPTPS